MESLLFSTRLSPTQEGFPHSLPWVALRCSGQIGYLQDRALALDDSLPTYTTTREKWAQKRSVPLAEPPGIASSPTFALCYTVSHRLRLNLSSRCVAPIMLHICVENPHTNAKGCAGIPVLQKLSARLSVRKQSRFSEIVRCCRPVLAPGRS